MRIYVLNIDAAPLFGAMHEHLTALRFRQSDLLVNGMFTVASVRSMYAGKVYDTIQPDDPLLIDLLLEDGFQVEVHGAYNVFVRDVLGEDGLPEGPLASNPGRLDELVPALKKRMHGNVVVSMPAPSGRRFRDWHDEERHAEFIEHEAACLRRIQADEHDTFTHITWSHYHDFVYDKHRECSDKDAYLVYLEKTLVEWLSLFDFDEPDAMFLIFSDHGDYVHRLTPPKDYLRWCFIRDNTAAPIVPGNLIAGIDVFRSVLEKITHPFDFADYDCRSMNAQPDHERIYHMADTRYWDANRSSVKLNLEKLATHDPIFIKDLQGVTMNATAVKVIDWKDERRPARLLQATYYRFTGKYYFLLYEPHEEDPIYQYGYFRRDGHEKTILRSLKAHENLRPNVLQLCQSLIDRFDWIENREYLAQIDSDDFPEWMEP